MKRLVLLILCLLICDGSSGAVYRSSYQQSVEQTSQYDLSIKILADNHRIEVTGTWRLPPAPGGRDQIEFYLSPKMEGFKVLLLEPKASAPLNLLSNEEDGGDRRWIFKPTQPIPVGQSVLLQFSYQSDGDAAPQFNVGPEGSFAGGGGELWYPQAAYKNRETGTLRFSVPTGEKVISNGALQSTQEQMARGEYVFRVTQPSKFGFASGKYTVIRRAGKVPFNLYLLRPRPQAQAILNGSARSLDFLTNLYGAFPYQEFSFVEVNFPTIVAGTSEFGFVLADDSKLDEFDLAYWAHEMGHQWWGNVVRSASGTTGQMMLSEGVTQFGALQAVEAVEGQAAAEQFRRNGYHGKGQSAASYFRLVQSGTDLPLTSYIPKSNETLTMHRLANAKGFILLDMLSRRIGRERFAAILRRFVRQKTNQTTSWQEFQQAIEANAGQDIHWFFEQWFVRTGAPDYQLTWKQDGKTVRGVITQPAPPFRATLEMEVNGSGGRRLLRKVEVVDGRTKFTWTVPFKVNSVILDPHYKVLRWLPEFRTQPVR
jgi:hypothetical protein